jgi:hypothetical protein
MSPWVLSSILYTLYFLSPVLFHLVRPSLYVPVPNNGLSEYVSLFNIFLGVFIFGKIPPPPTRKDEGKIEIKRKMQKGQRKCQKSNEVQKKYRGIVGGNIIFKGQGIWFLHGIY